MRLPDFLFIGPDKTGSSWIFEYLHAHPGCFVPMAKDIYFFDREYGRGLTWYSGFFADALDGQVCGEICHDYLLSETVAERIRDDLPQVKLIASLREPVDRAFSHYLYLRRNGITRLSFEDALGAFPELLLNSSYRTLLEPYRRHFDRERLLLLDYAQLKTAPDAFAERLCLHLGLEVRPGAEIGVVRPASRARSPGLARLLNQGAHLARTLGLQNLVGRIKRSRIASAAYVPLAEGERPEMQADTRAELERRFAPDLEWLQQEVGFDPSLWARHDERNDQSGR